MSKVTDQSSKDGRQELQMKLLDSNAMQEPEDQAKQGDSAERQIFFKDCKLVQYKAEQEAVPNIVRNQKFSVFSFVPLVLIKEFRHFFNLFYLLTAVSQFVPALKVGLLFSYLAPLLFVLLMTMLKEAYEDIQRYRKDKELNSSEFTKVETSGREVIRSKDIKVGDMLELTPGDHVPADCLLLASLNNKPVFIKTDQLDGETDWKLRKPVLGQEQPDSFVMEMNAPVANIYQFLGSFDVLGGEKMGLGLEQTLWRGVKIASGRAIVLVIYTGKQTKMSLNSKASGNKFGILDEELNFFSKILFLILLLLAIMLVILRGSYGDLFQSFILLIKYLLLLCYLIPISMRVNLDFAKLLYKFQIDRDPSMKGCQCRNSNIPEQLGRVSYVLTDKTGTLTQNQMIFRRLLLGENLTFFSEDQSQIKDIISGRPQGKEEIVGKKKLKRAIQALIICHNVTPVVDEDVRGLQGSSPDELTLVNFAEELGYVLVERNDELIVIDGPKGREQFEILQTFPFASESKNMGIMVRNPEGQILYYLKGADIVMGDKISLMDASFMEEACLDLARQGLRTLVISQKIISEEVYEDWRKDLISASASLKNRQERTQQCRSQVERMMEFVGVTGVEDKLQAGVVETVASLRSIGIKVWMLTGDKIETAICVGRAVRLIQSTDERMFVIQDAKSRGDFHEKIDALYKQFGLDHHDLPDRVNGVLVIDGTSLRWALMEMPKQFFNLAVRLPAIICSRVSPTQKAEIALLVRQFGEGRVLGIGDGGNDVALIQSAHVGVGIYGKEGIQAALASDFSISQFADLNSLIYWHGRLSYKRSSLLSQFVIHRGAIISIMQTIFCIQYFFVSLPIYNGFLLLGYTTIFTMLPVFSLVLDEDITRQMALEYPILYKRTLKGTELTLATFLYWMFISVYQGAVIMILIGLLFQGNSFYMVSTISFTCLVVIQFLNIFTELHRIKWPQVVSTLASLLLYLLAIFLMKNILNGIQLFSMIYLPATFAIIAAAWVPPFLYQLAKRCLNPTEEEKLMRNSHNIDLNVNQPKLSHLSMAHSEADHGLLI